MTSLGPPHLCPIPGGFGYLALNKLCPYVGQRDVGIFERRQAKGAVVQVQGRSRAVT